MKLVTTCSNAAEAGFFASLLESEGIAAYVSDSGIEISGAHHVRVQVGDEDWERAREILGAQAERPKDGPSTKVVDEHPASSFPFLGVAGLVGMIVMVLMTIVNFWTYSLGRWTSDTTFLDVLTASVVMGIFLGAVIGCFVALLLLVAQPVWKKLKSD